MPEASPIHYGHHAQNDRWVIEAVFPSMHGGFFVEAGACGGLQGSASYVLEREFGWNGICVEPGDRYYRTLRRDRSCLADPRCLSDSTGDQVVFLSFPEDLARSGIQSLNKNMKWAAERDAVEETATKETVTLNDLLDQHAAPTIIQYLCLDVEGAEPTILGAFDFDGDHRILALSIEGGRCDALLKDNGYQQVRNPFAPDRIDHYFVHETISGQLRDFHLPG